MLASLAMSRRPTTPRSLAWDASWFRLGRLGFSIAVAAVVAYHFWILAHRLLDASISEVPVLSRWISALLLGIAAWLLRRHRRSLFEGRTAFAFWLLVLLLHVGPSPLAVTADHGAELWLVLPIGAVSGLAFDALRVPRSTTTPSRRISPTSGRVPLPPVPVHPLAAGRRPRAFSPRPPPALVGLA